MPKFELKTIFELEDTLGSISRDISNQVVDCENITIAEKILEDVISEKISEFSSKELNWTLLEKCISEETVEDKSTNLSALTDV